MGDGQEHWDRVRALEEAGARGDRERVPMLLEVIEGDRECWHTLTAAIRSLVALGESEAAPAILRRLARDRDPDVREAAIDALVAFRHLPARRVLERIAREETGAIADAARGALARLAADPGDGDGG